MILPLTDLSQVTADWLAEALKLPPGTVSDLRVNAQDALTAQVAQLDVLYHAETPVALPRRMFLKLGSRCPEIDFYNLVAPAMADPPAPRCFDARCSSETGRGHVLLEDLSATYVDAGSSGQVLDELATPMVETLAAIHAAWWDHPRLHTDLAAASQHVNDFVLGVARETYPAFAADLGDALPEVWRVRYQRLLDTWPSQPVAQRLASGKHLTITHGDCHPFNWMVPRQPETGRLLLTDWAVWDIGVGAFDLAYMLDSAWFANRAADQSLVQHYHACLPGHGVVGYGWEQCWADYRIGKIAFMLWPVFWWKYAPPYVWRRAIESIMRDFEALKCAELLI